MDSHDVAIPQDRITNGEDMADFLLRHAASQCMFQWIKPEPASASC